MESPLQIDFQGLPPSPALAETIREKAAQIDRRFGRITACRVVVKSPGQHHRQGLYEVHIHMTLPGGREVAVGKLPHADERYADVLFAVKDTFKRARRQLDEKIGRMEDAPKAGPPPILGATTGRVARLLEDYGFIATDDGDELYFHRNAVAGKAFAQLAEGTAVSFAVEDGSQGPQAARVKAVERKAASR
jgi:cold shock CspA family protein/ribosome-associated translation inhibitor RaiA